MEEELKGLSAEEVIEKRSKGEGECQGESITRTPGQIVRDNLCTRFNALNFLIAVLLFAAGAYSNMLFIGVIILNILIGIAQELKAKKLVDELSILSRPRVRVIREGKEQVIGLEEVVKDDLTVLQSGDQICSDSVVADGELEVNESLLTGESDGVGKGKGDMLYSGSFVISGKARARDTHVGNENYAAGLAKEVKREKQVQSELLSSMRRVTNFTSFLIVPMGLALFLEALLLRQTAWDEAIVSSAAALLGMLPKGLVLLISVSLAAGVIRLGKMKTSPGGDGREKSHTQYYQNCRSIFYQNHLLAGGVRPLPFDQCSLPLYSYSDYFGGRLCGGLSLLPDDSGTGYPSHKGPLFKNSGFKGPALRSGGGRDDRLCISGSALWRGRKADGDVSVPDSDFHDRGDQKLPSLYTAESLCLRDHGCGLLWRTRDTAGSVPGDGA